jgi:hypothetical protein
VPARSQAPRRGTLVERVTQRVQANPSEQCAQAECFTGAPQPGTSDAMQPRHRVAGAVSPPVPALGAEHPCSDGIAPPEDFVLPDEPCAGDDFQDEGWEDLWEFDDEDAGGVGADPGPDVDEEGFVAGEEQWPPDDTHSVIDAGGYLPRMAHSCPAFVSDIRDDELFYTGEWEFTKRGTVKQKRRKTVKFYQSRGFQQNTSAQQRRDGVLVVPPYAVSQVRARPD